MKSSFVKPKHKKKVVINKKKTHRKRTYLKVSTSRKENRVLTVRSLSPTNFNHLIFRTKNEDRFPSKLFDKSSFHPEAVPSSQVFMSSKSSPKQPKDIYSSKANERFFTQGISSFGQDIKSRRQNERLMGLSANRSAHHSQRIIREIQFTSARKKKPVKLKSYQSINNTTKKENSYYKSYVKRRSGKSDFKPTKINTGSKVKFFDSSNQ